MSKKTPNTVRTQKAPQSLLEHHPHWDAIIIALQALHAAAYRFSDIANAFPLEIDPSFNEELVKILKEAGGKAASVAMSALETLDAAGLTCDDFECGSVGSVDDAFDLLGAGALLIGGKPSESWAEARYE